MTGLTPTFKYAQGCCYNFHFIECCRVPKVTEIVLVKDRGAKSACGQYPGLFIFTGPARMMRPVVNLALNAIELIGTFEQVCKHKVFYSTPWLMCAQQSQSMN